MTLNIISGTVLTSRAVRLIGVCLCLYSTFKYSELLPLKVANGLIG